MTGCEVALRLSKDKRLCWKSRIYMRMVYLARIPEGGTMFGDHRGWGAWRWLYLVPFLLARRALGI